MTTQLQLLLIAVAGWMSRHQQAVIEYLQGEIRFLLEQLGGIPKRFTDAQRIRLARKAKLVGRRRLGKLATLVTPDTLPLVPCPGRQKVDLSQDQSPRSTVRCRNELGGMLTITTAKPRELPFSMVSRVFGSTGVRLRLCRSGYVRGVRDCACSGKVPDCRREKA